MDNNELNEFLSEKDEIDLTDELIKELVANKKWDDEESLKSMRDSGAKWNTKRESVVFTPDEDFLKILNHNKKP